MKTRILSAIIAVALLVFVLYHGGTTLLVVSGILSLIGLYEFYRAYGKQLKPIASIGYLMTVILYIGFYFGMQDRLYHFTFIAGMQVLLAISVFSKRRMLDSMITYVGFFYVAYPILHINLLYRFESLAFVWLPFIIAISTDVFAY
ncbi:MAG: phosphatidate cytidylyltransferase, partial [Bacillota bacterium]|nr:phosphatidate cytidylyltransferase [Bacillota bacterium]